MVDLAQCGVASNMCKKPYEPILREMHYDPLPEDVRLVLIQSWKNFGMLPPGAVEKMVTAQDSQRPQPYELRTCKAVEGRWISKRDCFAQ